MCQFDLNSQNVRGILTIMDTRELQGDGDNGSNSMTDNAVIARKGAAVA